MGKRVTICRPFGLLAVVLVLFASQGCTYFQHRGEDFAEMLDLGVTFSKKPSLVVYAAAPFSLLSGIGGYMDGHFAGWGGGQFGVTRHYIKAAGIFVIGCEEIGWGEFDKRNPATLYRAYQGILGIPLSPFVWARPAYMPTCTHEIHLGWVGLVANLRYMEVIDFVVGWTTADIGGDDGKKLGHWPWRTEGDMAAEARSGRFWPW